ncbi:helix-turn-helix domain-containing protein [Nocardia spumae]|uniref:helix-turn-helix domain-containing protein n=1 Tax=Nocardia spumae TaxID=2887190 RepID=UPI001D143843|nr:helix-turn-helix domain-containing protein [Nocardia spumae]
MPVPDTSQTLSRGLDVLKVLASSPHARTPAQLATELGLSRTIIYRLVGTLVEHGLVRRGADGTVAISAGALMLTENVLGSVREATREILEDLAREAEATAHFCVADGDDVLAVAVVEPPFTTFHVAYRVGARTARGQGALGAAIEAAQRGEMGLFESEGQLVAGAHGIVAALPGLPGPPAAVGVVTLVGQETAAMTEAVRRAASRLHETLG